MTRPLLPFTLAALLIAPVMTLAQTSPALRLLPTPVEQPILAYVLVGQFNAVTPADIFEIEISESGGITDVFIRLAPVATTELADRTSSGTGSNMVVQLCGTDVIDALVQAPVDSGTFYIPNLDAVQAEALRAVWQGRDTCSTLPPEVFPLGQ